MRQLTKTEEKFIEEAEAGGFLVYFSEAGEPSALGAEKTGNLFSMEVIEKPDRDGSIYFVVPGYNE